MASNKKKYFLLVVFYFAIVISRAQISFPFIKYLYEKDLKLEHYTYLKVLEKDTLSNKDSVCFLFAKYYLHYFNDSLFEAYYKRCPKMFVNDTLAMNMASTRMLTASNKCKEFWFGQEKQNIHSVVAYQIFNFYYAINSCKLDSTNAYLLLDDKLYREYLKLNKRNSLSSAIMSSIIPGTGQFYNHRNKSGIFTLAFNVGHTAQVIESVIALGWLHPFTIFVGSTGALLYSANIYGSYQDHKLSVKEKKTQLLLNAHNYYMSVVDKPLY